LFFSAGAARKEVGVLNRSIFVLFSLVLLLLATALYGWPATVVEIRLENGTILFFEPVPEGWSFSSGIIHSLERTPVEDEYRVVGGQIWQWQERFRSNNAGLPTVAPSNGRFFSSSEWFVLQGGRNRWKSLDYRVGTSTLGKNILTLENYGAVALYERLAGERIRFEARSMPLGKIAPVLNLFDFR
jgi:hypothetical protein